MMLPFRIDPAKSLAEIADAQHKVAGAFARLARMRDQMRFRARRLHQRYDARQSGFGIEPNVFGPNAEYHPASTPTRRWRSDKDRMQVGEQKVS